MPHEKNPRPKPGKDRREEDASRVHQETTDEPIMALTADELNIAMRLPGGVFVLPLERWHLLRLAEANGSEVDDAMLMSQVMSGFAVTMFAHGRVAACWGLVLPWRGLAEGWMVSNREALRPVAAPFTYGVRRFCDIAAKSLQLRRIQIHVKTTNDTFVAWARAAKFKREALLEGYAEDGSDVWLMAKTYRRQT